MTKSTKTPTRKRVDWEAIERDYRTDQFTLRELERKHGANNTTIARRAAKAGWTKDLSDAVRQATNAALITATVQQKCSSAQQNAADTVLAAAEVNKQVIMGHRTDIREVRDVAADLLNEIRAATQRPEQIEALFAAVTDEMDGPAKVAITQQFMDFMRVHSRIGSIHKLADTFTKIQAAESKAFGIDSPDTIGAGSKTKPVGSKTVYELTDDELVADIMARRAQASL